MVFADGLAGTGLRGAIGLELTAARSAGDSFVARFARGAGEESGAFAREAVAFGFGSLASSSFATAVGPAFSGGIVAST
jgi:hypothetical protein